MERLYRRKLEDRLWKFMRRREILAVRGPRQAGKTTLLRLMERKVRGSKVFINLDLPAHRRALSENPLDFMRRLKEEGRRLVLFMDEIQRVEKAGGSLKILYDEFPDVKMVISGSSSLELKTDVLPSLVGRVLLFDLLPFDFEEFLLARDPGLWRVFREKNRSLMGFVEGKDEPEEPSFSEDFLRLWKEYVIYGGYPEVVKSRTKEEREEVLRNIFDLYLEKDVVTFFRITDAAKFEDFVRALAFKVSSTVALSSLASDLKLSYQRAEEFMEILRHTYIVSWLRPFARNLVTELKKAPKVYFWDPGMRNAALRNFSEFEVRTDQGALAENFAFRHLSQSFGDFGLHYWRTAGGAEVDFVLTRGEELVPVEVRLGGGRPGRSLHSFLQAYRPERGIVLTLGTFEKQEVSGTRLRWVPLFYL